MHLKSDQFFDSLKHKNVAVIGIGVSHTDLIHVMIDKGIQVTLCDKRNMDQLQEKLADFDLSKLGLQLGASYLDNLPQFDVIFRTPGMKYYEPQLQEARQHGCVVTSEMEAFFDLCPCKIIAVTGSDGKTTTTTLISEMLKAQGYTVHLGGNIGRALLPIIEQVKEDDFAVVELSSFQLISMRKSPDVSVITNLAPNHLDMHKDMQEYIDAKKNIFLHQGAFTKTILNVDNDITRSFSSEIRGDLWYFSRKSTPYRGTCLSENGMLMLYHNGQETPLFHMDEIRLPGIHNIENYLAATAAVSEYVAPETMRKVAKEFGGVEHRIEFVRELNGVKWYNDSIATSPTRAIAGLNSFNQKLILIAGGYDKKIPFEPMVPYLIAKVKTLILCGDTAVKIEAAVKNFPGYQNEIKIIRADDLPHAVSVAHQLALSGDIVSLSPASASFDHYPNFEARGRHFKTLVHQLV